MKEADEAGIRQYAEVMAEIKRRSRVIDHFMSGRGAVIYKPTTIETIGLQFRKIFELIAFSSLAANKKLYEQAYANFSRHWEAAKLIANLRRLNPAFYPVPVLITDSNVPGIKSNFTNRTEGFLTPEQLIEYHGRCGTLLHAANPFGRDIDYDSYHKRFTEWHELIITLLNAHKIQLPDDPSGFWLLQMGDFSTDRVSYDFFAQVAYDQPAS